MFQVSDPFGVQEVDESFTGIESGAVVLLVDGIHFLQVGMLTKEPSTFRVSTDIRIKPFRDPDDGQAIAVGDTVAGNLDFSLDRDWYSIRLEEGETVKISTDSINVDTALFVDFPNSHESQVVTDDNSGGGLFGTNSELVYRAPNTGEYFIAVTVAVGDNTGGYFLSVEQAPPGSETVYVPPAPTETDPQEVEPERYTPFEVVFVADSPFGVMLGLVFIVPSRLYEIQVPAYWIEEEPDPSEYEVFGAFDPDENGAITIYVEEGVHVSLAEYADALESGLFEAGAEGLTRESVQTARGLPVVLFEWTLHEAAVAWLTYVSDDGVAVDIVYTFPAGQFDAGRELAYYSFDTFLVY